MKKDRVSCFRSTLIGSNCSVDCQSLVSKRKYREFATVIKKQIHQPEVKEFLKPEVSVRIPEVLETQEKGKSNGTMADNDTLREFGFYIEGVLLVSDKASSG